MGALGRAQTFSAVVFELHFSCLLLPMLSSPSQGSQPHHWPPSSYLPLCTSSLVPRASASQGAWN